MTVIPNGVQAVHLSTESSISETLTTSNKPKETIRQIDNEQYDSHTNPCTISVRISYQH